MTVAANQGPAHQAQHGGLALSRHGVPAPEVGGEVHQICVVSRERYEASSPARLRGQTGEGVHQFTASCWSRHSSVVQRKSLQSGLSGLAGFLIKYTGDDASRGWVIQQLLQTGRKPEISSQRLVSQTTVTSQGFAWKDIREMLEHESAASEVRQHHLLQFGTKLGNVELRSLNLDSSLLPNR